MLLAVRELQQRSQDVRLHRRCLAMGMMAMRVASVMIWQLFAIHSPGLLRRRLIGSVVRPLGCIFPPLRRPHLRRPLPPIAAVLL